MILTKVVWRVDLSSFKHAINSTEFYRKFTVRLVLALNEQLNSYGRKKLRKLLVSNVGNIGPSLVFGDNSVE